jgi:predicted Zn-dependent protease
MRILFRPWLLTLLFAVTAGQLAAENSPLTFSVKNDDYQALKSTIASKDQSTISPFEQFQLAVSAWRLGDLKAAKKRLKPLIDANYAIGDSLYLKGLIHLSEVDRVSVFKKLGAAKKAREAWIEAIEKDPQHALSLFAIVGFFSQAPGIAGGDVDKARLWLTRLETVDNSFYQLGQGLIAAKTGALEDAERHLLLAVEDPDDQPLALMQLAQFYLRTDQFDRAINHLVTAQKQPRAWHHPTSTQLLMMQGFAVQAQGDKDEARRLFAEALAATQNPNAMERIQNMIAEL